MLYLIVLSNLFEASSSVFVFQFSSRCFVSFKFILVQTRLLVTNKLHLLNEAEMIVNLENGQIKELGTFQELFRKQTDDPMSFAQLCKTHMVQEQQEEEKEEKMESCRQMSEEACDQSPSAKRKSFHTSQRSIG